MVKKLITRMIQAIVDNPDEVKVTEPDAHQSIMFELKVAKSDIGKVIGKQGRNAQAIRTILGVAAAKLKKSVRLEILED